MTEDKCTTSMALKFLEIEENLARDLLRLEVGSGVKYVYNPIDYAVETHRQFLERCFVAGNEKDVLFLGMNPGPWGMSQTGKKTITLQC